MSTMTRPMWAAMLAKMVAPMEPERAAKAIAGILPALSYPDDAFTLASVKAVASEGRVMEAEVRGAGGAIIKTAAYGPMTRVPTFGEIETALGRWWWNHRDMQRVMAAPVVRERLPAPADYTPEPRVTEDAKAHVAEIVGAFVSERSWKDPSHVEHKPVAAPAHLSDGHLLAAYERMAAEGLPGASVRVKMLRKRLGQSERMAAE